MTETVTYSTVLKHETCWCGIKFAAPEDLVRVCRDQGQHKLHCPLGHLIVWEETAAQRLEKQLLRERAAHDQTRADAEQSRRLAILAERRAAAARGQVTKIKRRVANGVCVCCQRFFANLAQHMHQEHPDFEAE